MILSSMFYDYYRLFELNLSSFNTIVIDYLNINVNDISCMFYKLDFLSFNKIKTNYMTCIFYYYENLS